MEGIKEQARKEAENVWNNKLQNEFTEKINESNKELLSILSSELNEFNSNINQLFEDLNNKLDEECIPKFNNNSELEQIDNNKINEIKNINNDIVNKFNLFNETKINNKNFNKLPFYDSRFMRYFEKVDDIDIEWVREQIKIDYGYSDEFSPLHILKMIDMFFDKEG